MSKHTHPIGKFISWCPQCQIEKADAEASHNSKKDLLNSSSTTDPQPNVEKHKPYDGPIYMDTTKPLTVGSVELQALLHTARREAKMETANHFRGNGWQTDNAIDIYLDELDGGNRYESNH